MSKIIQSQEVIAWLQALSTLFSFFALILSVGAIYFTVVSFRLKKGIYVRGQYSWTLSDIATHDPYVNEVLLENLKDRSIVIFGIYLKISHGYYICLEKFEGEPLVIKPFEVSRRLYGPIDGYSFNWKRVNIEALKKSNKKMKIILSTTDGMVNVRKPVSVKDPAHRWFENHLIITLNTDRFILNGRAYGAATKYVVEIYEGKSVIERIPLYGKDYEFKWFRELGGVEEDLSSTESVKLLFEEAVAKKIPKATHVEVIDYQSALRNLYRDYTLDPIIAKRRSWLLVNVLGKFLTAMMAEELKNKRPNKGD